MKDWTFRFLKNRYVSVIMINNDRLENVPPSLELIRILNYTVKGTGIEISDWKESCMSGTHVSKQGVLSCTLSLSIICGKSLSWNSFSISYSILQKHNETTLNIYTANNPLLFLSIMLMYLNLLSFCGDPPLRMFN